VVVVAVAVMTSQALVPVALAVLAAVEMVARLTETLLRALLTPVAVAVEAL
jgi:hypothetical protein